MALKKLGHRRLVLVVEDQDINRDVLGMILEDEYDIIYATNGKEALESMQEYIDRLSIVLLDLMMPVMDGFEVLEAVREDPGMQRIPIIVLTADKSAELRALKLGAADFITKPYDMHEVILARVGRIIELSEGRHLINVAEKDPVTGLYSHSFFLEYAEQIRRYHPDWQLDALALNVERFHSVNELNGREFGDRMLEMIGTTVQGFLAESDGIACREEGDQFFLYCRHQDDYSVVLERFQKAVEAISGRVDLRLRLGVSPYTPGILTEVQIERARRACNMVRGSYLNHLMVYDEEMLKRESYQERLLNDLPRAIEEGEFKVFYQPKYDIQCEPCRLNSAEALIRWNHHELGMIPPCDFIPLFEKNGLVHIVDRFVWKEVANQIAKWREKYNILFPISVNLSRAEILDSNLEESLKVLIAKYDLPVSAFKLEVTESAYTDDKQLVEIVRRLRESGYEIEMDDFGAGYSSLNMISSLPIDVLKMDMGFIRNIKEDNRELRLVELILDIARYMDVPVVAEGVETEEQLELLRKANCRYVQGYYFSRPLPAQEFEQWIEREIVQNRKKGGILCDYTGIIC